MLNTENDRFKHVRTEVLKLSRKDMGEILGKKQQTIYDIENGKINVQVSDLRILHEKYSVNPRYILLSEQPIIDEGSKTVDSIKGFEAAVGSDINRLFNELETKHPESGNTIKSLRQKIDELTQERDELMRKLIGMHEELMKLYKKI